jgi:TPR repeat protein
MIFKELVSVAEAGRAEAQYKVGVIYENGQGVEDNCMAAARWYKLSTDQGYAKAQFNLALFCKSGTGVTQNLQTAKHWMEQTANANMSEAIGALAASKKLNKTHTFKTPHANPRCHRKASAPILPHLTRLHRHKRCQQS